MSIGMPPEFIDDEVPEEGPVLCEYCHVPYYGESVGRWYCSNECALEMAIVHADNMIAEMKDEGFRRKEQF
jgi:hypothetical protein